MKNCYLFSVLVLRNNVDQKGEMRSLHIDPYE